MSKVKSSINHNPHLHLVKKITQLEYVKENVETREKEMKLFFVLTVATSALSLLVQGAPSPSKVTSEQIGKTVHYLQQQLLEAAKEKPALDDSIQQIRSPHQLDHGYQPPYRVNEEIDVTTQVSGVNINNCGFLPSLAGLILNGALSAFRSQFGVLVDCQATSSCIEVRVDVPADDLFTRVYICNESESCLVN